MKSYRGMKKHIHNHGGQCAKCPSINRLTVDHIIPQQLLYILGLSEAIQYHSGNLQILCEADNKLKGNALDFSNPKTVPLLREFVELAIRRHTRPPTRKLTVRCQCGVVHTKVDDDF